MNKVYCLPQRQNGEVIGIVNIVEKDGHKNYDLSSARLVSHELQDGEDGSDVAMRELEKQTNIRPQYAIPIYTSDAGDATVYDMDIKLPMSPKTENPDTRAMWCNPWHLVNGPDGEIARQVFAANGTAVKEPIVYEGRRNLEVVPEDPNETEGDDVI